MNDAGQAFKQLRTDVGTVYDARAMHADLDVVEQRIERARRGRAAAGSGIVLAVIGVLAVLAPQFLGEESVAPAITPTPRHSVDATTAPITEAEPEVLIPCIEAQGVSGKAYENPNGEGSLGGFMGWWDSQATGDVCESRESWGEEMYLAEAHPDVVWINTIDNTMMDATYRTNIDALGVYGTLPGDSKIPDPDPTWPADRLILIDAHTGEVLIVEDPSEVEFYE